MRETSPIGPKFTLAYRKVSHRGVGATAVFSFLINDRIITFTRHAVNISTTR